MRTFIYGIVIFISYIADYLNFYTAILGLFSVKITIIFGVFYKKGLFKFIKNNKVYIIKYFERYCQNDIDSP